ncbi:ArsR/SmtB family transcription factor [Streptomyces sp. NPDC001480]|uniref:ArsR/SmtB family transcription factor n=1 Tax=Streptomyces sp. NPDC001480 TaxID=3364577 RepID=UPI0036B2FE38
MLRIHFGPEDLARVRVARTPDPLWEIACSLHRLQTTRGRWAYADWYSETRATLAGGPLGRAVRRLLIPVLPRARYMPDFLTPPEAAGGLEDGFEAILDTPAERVTHEMRLLDRLSGAPGWAPRLSERAAREELVNVLRAYHEAIIAPYEDRILATITGERALCARETLDAGVGGLLSGLSPGIRWYPPVLHVDYVEDRDLYLGGRGLRLVPSYFCWHTPVSLADEALEPVLIYPVHGIRPSASARPADASLAALLGRTRATTLQALAPGATTSELAGFVGVSPATVTHHVTVLRDAGLVQSRRRENTVLHTLTPLGAAMLRRTPPVRPARAVGPQARPTPDTGP